MLDLGKHWSIEIPNATLFIISGAFRSMCLAIRFHLRGRRIGNRLRVAHHPGIGASNRRDCNMESPKGLRAKRETLRRQATPDGRVSEAVPVTGAIDGASFSRRRAFPQFPP